jgi:hypothetical protein
MDLVHQLDARTYGIASYDPLIVVVQPTHDRKSDQLVPCILGGKNRSALLWDLLRNPLMGSCLIEVDHIHIEHALELLLMQDQQMVQAFLSHTPQKAFADRIGSWGLNRRFEDLDRARFHYPSKARPELAIVITNQVLRCEPIRGRFSQLLGHPGIRRRSGHAHVDHLP